MNTILTDDDVDELTLGRVCTRSAARAIEAAVLAKLAQQEPVAMRYDFDGYGYKYIDSGSGSDWRSRIPDAEAVYAAPLPAPQQADRQRVPEGWIETSKAMPPSGQVVLACYKNELGNTRRIRAQWVAAKTSEASIDSDCGEYDEATDTYYDPEGWYECIDNWDCYSSVFVSAQITHWMPLPAAPGAAPEATAQEKSNG